MVYLAQSPHYRKTPEMAGHLLRVNGTAAVETADLARRAGVDRFIYASTGSVYAPSFAPLAETSPLRRDRWYPLSKVHAEEALALFRDDLNLTVLRPFGMYGPGQTTMLVPHLVRLVAKGDEVFIDQNPGDAADQDGLRISLCYVDDAAEIVRRLLERQGPDVLNLAGPRAVSIREIAQQIGAEMNREPNFVMADRERETDLVADLTLLNHTVAPKFTDLEIGIRETLKARDDQSGDQTERAA